MNRRLAVFTIGLILLLFATLSTLDRATTEVSAQAVPTPSDCTASADKSVDPATIPLGQDTGVTLVVSGTCGAEPVPVDVVIVADESMSMTAARGGPPDVPTDRPPPVTGTPRHPHQAASRAPDRCQW